MKHLGFLIILICLISCSRKTESLWLHSAEDLESLPKEIAHNCNNPDYYSPDSLFKTKLIKVNVHFMDNEEGDKNFDLKDGRKYMKALISNANVRLKDNKKMNLPPGNETAVLQPYYQYKIVGDKEIPNDDGFYKAVVA